MKNRDIYWRRYKIQETLCMGQWHLSSLQSRHLGTHTVLPITISYPIIFSWISLTVWNLFPFKGDFSFGKSQKSQGAKYGLYGGWVTWMIWCFLKNLFTRCDAWASVLLSWWSWQSPVAHSCGLLNHLNRFFEGMFKLNTNLMQIRCSTCRHFECDSHIVHVLTQQQLPPPLTSTVKSSLFTHAHSSPLDLATRLHWCWENHSRQINNGWTFSGQTSSYMVRRNIQAKGRGEGDEVTQVGRSQKM